MRESRTPSLSSLSLLICVGPAVALARFQLLPSMHVLEIKHVTEAYRQIEV
jgi:hypothetical protein